MPNPQGRDYWYYGYNPGFGTGRTGGIGRGTGATGLFRNLFRRGGEILLREGGRRIFKATELRFSKYSYLGKLQRRAELHLARGLKFTRLPYCQRRQAARFIMSSLYGAASSQVRRGFAKIQGKRNVPDPIRELLGGSRMARYYPRRRRWWSYGRTRRYYRGRSRRSYGRRY